MGESMAALSTIEGRAAMISIRVGHCVNLAAKA
jgi:hypothetical protein